MFKSSLIKIGIIGCVLMMLLLSSCNTTEKGKDTAQPSASVETTHGTLASKEPVGSKAPDVSDGEQTANPNQFSDNNNSDGNEISNQTSEPANDEELTEKPDNSNFQIILDKNIAKEGEIITAKIVLNNIANVAGYQVNIKYDPNVLQAVNLDTGKPLENKQMPNGGDVLVNPEYNSLPLVANDVENGVINFGRAYVYVDKYKEGNKPENGGVLALIGFKVLKEESTTIAFADSPTMPNAVLGTYVYDWNFKVLSNYSVSKGVKIN
ncbi:MAG TPA: cohesin domain-containing protein [Acetivibrio sp.]|uniref:cohesin domain-containing protein n=1 Tax=Acetivibrio sp. TaxID=1872092 RepID=UPI002B56826E|nr:cohesin domain-containing protein [Acetivibrio sp.]HOM01739.1 cohesin domain-containing protein [Acetivibrio sp.]